MASNFETQLIDSRTEGYSRTAQDDQKEIAHLRDSNRPGPRIKWWRQGFAQTMWRTSDSCRQTRVTRCQVLILLVQVHHERLADDIALLTAAAFG